MNYRNVLVLLTALTAWSGASAETEAGFGWVSEYIYRGVPHGESSGFADFHWGKKGFSAGVLAMDLDYGMEFEGHLGYHGKFGDALSYDVGATGYYYSDHHLDTMQELNFSVGYGFVKIDSDIGKFDNFDGPTQDYVHTALTLGARGFRFTAGTYGQDFDGEYYEAGYATEAAGFDLSVMFVHSSTDLLGAEDNSIVFGIRKAFSIGDGFEWSAVNAASEQAEAPQGDH